MHIDRGVASEIKLPPVTRPVGQNRRNAAQPKEEPLNVKRIVTVGTLIASLLGLTACTSTPDGQISEIEGAINGAVLEVWSTTANDNVDIAVVADHNCELGDIYFVCLKPGDVLGRTDVPRYHGEGFEEESTENDE